MLKFVLYTFLNDLMNAWEWICFYDESEMEDYDTDNFDDYFKKRIKEFVDNFEDFVSMYGEDLQESLSKYGYDLKDKATRQQLEHLMNVYYNELK